MEDAQLDALLARGRVIPVITIDRLADAIPLARALVAGGICLLGAGRPVPVGAVLPHRGDFGRQCGGLAGVTERRGRGRVVLTPAADIATGRWDRIETLAR